MMEGPLSADSEEKHEPASDIDTLAVESLIALDSNRPIREADMSEEISDVRFTPRKPTSKCCSRSDRQLATDFRSIIQASYGTS